ncbi:serine/threonine-protein kinase [Mycobacterium sp.]|uniref:serine/threonine-protein kinase n=1 Tax=Mycobacterium sp. TaxID=1785 RepID=UPI002C30F989|nr:serine/threonine-protein kinase [Mycobacterium sp.]HTQ18765.1 serine/threonine-protein kinase [Mycobacterium sp.]
MEGGTPFGRYRLMDLLGRGGMGEVWRAFDTVTERTVALKVLPTQYAGDAVFQERFRREARSAAGLDEPHVVPIHDFGEVDGRLFVTMRLIKGRDLGSILGEGRMDASRAVGIIDQVASALHAAHQVNLVHRDVKPSNILVCEDDFAYLIDFGIARIVGQTALTNTSSVIGTWAYMAPERLTAGQIDARADIYALACVLYECLTGSQPFRGDSMEQQIGGHLTMPPPRPSDRRTDVPAELDAVIAKGMAKKPDDRYSTTRELAHAARTALTGPIPRQDPLPPVITGPPHNPYPQPVDVTNRTPPPGTPLPTDPTQYRAAPYGSTPPPGPIPTPVPPPGGPSPTDATQYRAVPYGSGPPSGPIPPPVPLHGGPPPADPGLYRPMQYSSTPPAAPTSNKGKVIALSSVGALAVVVALVVGLVWWNSGNGGEDTSSHARPTPTEVPNSGPFTGAFTAAMGPATLTDGTPAKGDSAPYTAPWRLRSVCGSKGCVATAASGGKFPVRDLVFDKVGDGWIAVSNYRIKCGFRDDDEAWNVVSLQPQADGSLSGESSETTVNGCFTKRTIAFSRTGDTDISALPDPATLPARVVSAAEALHGAYDSQTVYANGAKSVVDHFRVRTDCLRAGDRCMSRFFDPKRGGGQTFVFAVGAWSRNEEFDSSCSSGGTNHVTYTASLPLPQPTPNPIPVLSGHGYDEVKGAPGSTCHSQAFDETFTRTAD